MAKKTTKRSHVKNARTARTTRGPVVRGSIPPVAAQLVTSPLPQAAPGSVDLGNGVMVNVAIQLDPMKIAKTKAREALTKQRHAITLRLNKAKGEHDAMTNRLSSAATQAISVLEKEPAAVAAAEALTAFRGVSYIVKIRHEKCELDAQQVTAQVVVLKASDYREERRDNWNTGYSYGHDLTKEGSVPFTQEMRELVAQLQEKTLEINAIQGELDVVADKIADLPNIMDRVEAALGEAYLNDELHDGRDVMAIIHDIERGNMPALPAPDRD